LDAFLSCEVAEHSSADLLTVNSRVWSGALQRLVIRVIRKLQAIPNDWQKFSVSFAL